MTAGVSTPGRVLVIDDDRMVGRMLVAHIRAAGFEAKVTDDPDEFIELVESWKPTHVFVDLVMGETDGLEMLSRLARARCTASVVIQSGMGGRVLDAARQFAEANGLAYAGLLPKPFTRDAVAKVLAQSPHIVEETHTEGSLLHTWSAEQFEDELRGAAANGDLAVAFQPKIGCASGRVAGFEALARWTHPVLGAIPPLEYVTRAETVGLIEVITDTVALQALTWFGQSRHDTKERMAINVSAAELSHRTLDDRLRVVCEAANVEPRRVVLEVTETAAIGDQTVSLEILTRLRLAGFHLSIDDFGTGYSSMAQLASMPFSEVKVDRSFVRNLGDSLPAEVMVRSMLQLGRGLGLECTAEGVETQVALDVLTRMGCDYAQGYHIARPMPVEEIEAWLGDCPA
jgi:EAL domain-containing protein (putative c-di-GMP-specific phosphodiesterase class I)/ActR/RegA family two-component response regulator